MTQFNDFDRGFVVVDADQPKYLEVLRNEVFGHAKAVFSLPDAHPAVGFNDFHLAIKSLSGGEFNKLRIELIKRLSAECDVRELVYKAFELQIARMLGPDVLAQKNSNLVLQPPNDPFPSELHRDAPINSPYEIVVWVPLVDCFGTKAMYLLDVDNTRAAMDYLDANPMDWTAFEQYARSLAVVPPVAYGQALVFHTGCLHGSDVNTEAETRVSLNIRYKGLFSPSGLKNQLQFFDVLRLSSVARLGGMLEARELLK